MANGVEHILLATAIILLTLVTTCQTDTEREEVRYMSLRSRLHAPQALSALAPRRKSHPYMDATYLRGVHPPKRKNMKREKLLKKLGKDYNPRFMSFVKPDSNKREPEVTTKYTLDPLLLGELRNLNLSSFIEDNKDDLVRKPDVQKVMEKWLLQRASCPIHFVWDDLGTYFWPRWVRKGNCGNDFPCSWPPGMHCVPAESQTIFLLRWHCRRKRYKSEGKRNRKRNQRAKRDVAMRPDNRQTRSSHLRIQLPSNRWHKKQHRPKKDTVKCRWTKVRYPVTAECFCSC